MHDESVFFLQKLLAGHTDKVITPSLFSLLYFSRGIYWHSNNNPYISSLFVGPHPLSNMLVIPARQSKSNPNEYLFFSLINHSSPLCLSTYDMQS